MLNSKMVVSVTEGTGDNRKRKEIGSVDIFTPDLSEIAKIVAGAKETGKDESDGLPIYDTQEANWVFGALHNAVKMAARNKLENKTLKLKDGLKIAETIAELTEEGQRAGNGEGLAVLREAKLAFAEYVATLGKSEATQSFITTMFSNRGALQTQSKEVKAKMLKYVEDFGLYLSEADPVQFDRFTRPLEAVVASCSAPATLEPICTANRNTSCQSSMPWIPMRSITFVRLSPSINSMAAQQNGPFLPALYSRTILGWRMGSMVFMARTNLSFCSSPRTESGVNTLTATGRFLTVSNALNTKPDRPTAMISLSS